MTRFAAVCQGAGCGRARQWRGRVVSRAPVGPDQVEGTRAEGAGADAMGARRGQVATWSRGGAGCAGGLGMRRWRRVPRGAEVSRVGAPRW